MTQIQSTVVTVFSEHHSYGKKIALFGVFQRCVSRHPFQNAMATY